MKDSSKNLERKIQLPNIFYSIHNISVKTSPWEVNLDYGQDLSSAAMLNTLSINSLM
jgi:hypothetical protein